MKTLISILVALGVAFPAMATAKPVTAKPGEEVIIHVKPSAVEKAKQKYEDAVRKDKESKKNEMKVKVPVKDDDKAKTDEPKTDEPVDEHDVK
jgi:beta-lactam-binding protein with PASTA domain